MSGENRRPMGWILPVIVVVIGVGFALNAIRSGALNAVRLKAVNWAGLAVMAVGAVAAFMKKPLWKLAGVLACAVGAVMVIYL